MDKLKVFFALIIIGSNLNYVSNTTDPWCFSCQCLPFLIICQDVVDVHFTQSITLSTDTLMLHNVNFSSDFHANRLIQQFPFLITFIAVQSQLDCEFVKDYYCFDVNVTMIDSCYFNVPLSTTQSTTIVTLSTMTTAMSTIATSSTMTTAMSTNSQFTTTTDSNNNNTSNLSFNSDLQWITFALSITGVVISTAIIIGIIIDYVIKQNKRDTPPILPRLEDLEMGDIFGIRNENYAETIAQNRPIYRARSNMITQTEDAHIYELPNR